jgi:2-polyprenyl-3-methyl-5-hydroxy-6-metoxy-1,4-benzoquinol methylase
MPETIETQRAAWNEWNASTREKELQAISTDQADVIEEWIGSLHRRDLKILEVGCGAGWMAERLSRFGKVTAVDLADEVLTRAAKRLPQVSFIAGDFMALDVGGDYDVIVSLEVLSHVVDQPAFVAKIADLLRPGHYLMLATQNRYALEKSHLPRIPGQLRKWTSRRELHGLLAPRFNVQRMFSITPHFNQGFLRILNSDRLQRIADRALLGWTLRAVKRIEEKAWLGWTIMALACRNEESVMSQSDRDLYQQLPERARRLLKRA